MVEGAGASEQGRQGLCSSSFQVSPEGKGLRVRPGLGFQGPQASPKASSKARQRTSRYSASVRQERGAQMRANSQSGTRAGKSGGRRAAPAASEGLQCKM